MAKKIRRVRTFARTATKSQEKSLIENAKKIRKNPYVILPECTDESCTKIFIKTRKKLEKIHRFKDDSDKLDKLSNKKGLEGALAGTLLLALSEKAPYLGVLKFPNGDITYAQRGKAEKEKLIAIQHFDDPVLRLLGVKDMAFKKKLYLYSWDTSFVCSGQRAQPPKDFVDYVIKKLHFPYKQHICSCEHIDAKKVQTKQCLDLYYLRIYWKSAETVIALCQDCAKSSKNTMFTLSKYMVAPDLSEDFEIDVVAEVIKQKQSSTHPETLFIQEYLSGKLSDYEFINKNIKNRKKEITDSDEKILVNNGVSYGSDINGFVDTLQPKKYERDALLFILEQIDEPVVVNDITPNRFLELYWKDYGKEYLEHVIDDADLVESFFQLDDTPSNILSTIKDFQNRQHILSQLPQFSSLPPLALFADTVARTYKTFGEKNALNEIKKRPDTPKGKSLAYAFLLALDKGIDTKWKYSKEEIEYGEFLMKYAKNLLESSPKKYSQYLQELLTVSGSNETITD